MKDTVDNKTIDMLKPAAQTGAERQKAYREKQKKGKFVIQLRQFGGNSLLLVSLKHCHNVAL